jgi:DNA polymerase III alpha subunit (gram-positive type)
MSSIERRPDGTLIVSVRITLKPGRDDPLIDLVQRALPHRLARTIREAMRSGVSVETVEEEDIIDLTGLGMDL